MAGVGGLLALAEALSCARHKSATSCGGCDGSLGRGLNLCKSYGKGYKVSGPRRDSVYNPLKPFKFLKLKGSFGTLESQVPQGSIYPTGTRFHIPDFSLISGSPGGFSFNPVPGPRYAGNLSRKPRLPSLSPCTGSRLPGLTRQEGKHTLQRPKTAAETNRTPRASTS